MRRLFAEHLGTTPPQIERTRRLHFARRLLRETDLKIAEVCTASGFGSSSRFNEAFQRSYGTSPSRFRKSCRAQRATGPKPQDAVLCLELSYRPPFDWGSLLSYLAVRAVPGVEEVTARSYSRSFEWRGVSGVLRVRDLSDEDRLALELWVADSRSSVVPDLLAFVSRVRALFDLDADPAGLASLAEDPLMAELLERFPGVRVARSFAPFETAVRVVLGQQVSVVGATTLSGRLVERWGRDLAVEAPAQSVVRRFPEPEDLVEADVGVIGMPARRAESIRRLAHKVHEGAIRFDGTMNPAEVRKRLLQVPGLGPWTADMIALRCLGDSDTFPAGDLGIRKALAKNGELPSEAAALKRAEEWRPWRSYAARLLWSSLG